MGFAYFYGKEVFKPGDPIPVVDFSRTYTSPDETATWTGQLKK